MVHSFCAGVCTNKKRFEDSFSVHRIGGDMIIFYCSKLQSEITVIKNIFNIYKNIQ